MFFVSRLLGQTVRDVNGHSVGTLHDLVVRLRSQYPTVTALVVKRGRKRVFAPWAAVASFEESGSLLRIPATELHERDLEEDEILLAAQILDKQIVDTEGRKLIRVNDIQLTRSGTYLRVVAVDISSGAILRRIGLAKVSARLSKNPKPRLIDWRHVDPRASESGSVRLTVPRHDLSLLHPADIAELAHELSPEERVAVLDALEDDVAADAVEEMHPAFQASLVNDMDDAKASELLSNMSPDDAADLLADLPPERAQRLLSLMDKAEAADVRELLTYPEHSAGGIMTTAVTQVPPDVTAEEAIDLLRQQEPVAETLYYVYVTDKRDHLLGVFSLRDLLMQPPQRKVREFMTKDPIAVRLDASEEEVTRAIAKYNLLALPVVDEDNVLHGIITVDDAIDLILPPAWKKRLPRIFH